ncbi:MAG TPA: TonB-dependent receptor [Steroidobacteraceae bacterium]|nr:TonB-dependent receptor [Steroidobacteraceae bacterium]
MRNKCERVLRSAVLISVCGTCALSSAWAQEQPNRQDGRTGPVEALEEIVVTAQKRSELLQDVPIAVSAFGDKQRDELGLITAQDFATFTPGLSYSSDGNRLFLRGIGQTTTQGNVEVGVGTYTDGVYNSGAGSIATPAILIDHVEVLRGPQGTLYGRNTQGGAINVVSKRPTDHFEAEFRQALGNDQTSRSGVTVAGPINERLRYRAAGTFNYQGEGYTDNIARSYHLGSDAILNLQLEADVTDDLKVWMKGVYAYIYQHPDQPYNGHPYDTTTDSFNGGVTINPLFGYTGSNPALTDHRKIEQNTVPLVHLKSRQFELTADWNLGAASLRYVGGYNHSELHVTADLDDSARSQPFLYTGSVCVFVGGCTISPVDIADITSTPVYYSNELDLISQSETRLKWILGLYQYHERNNLDSNLHRPLEAALTALPNNPTGSYIDAIGGTTISSWAAFGQADYALSRTFTLQAGLRESHDKKDSFSGLPYLAFSGPVGLLLSGFTSPAARIPTGPAAYFKDSWQGLTARVALQWHPDADTNLYALFASGYKAGAITDPSLKVRAPGAAPAPQVLPAEHLYDYELGLKKVLRSSLRLNLAAFYYNYKNMQVQTTGPDPTIPGNFVPTFVSAPKARVLGFESELNWQVTRHIDGLLSYSYLDAKIQELNNVVDQSLPAPRQLQNVSGNRLPFTSKHQLALNSGYTWTFAPGSLRFGATYAYTSARYYDIFSTPTYRAPGYSQVDLRALWRSANDHVELIGFVSNLLDRESVNFLSLTNGTANTALTLNPPRTFGAELQLRF